MWHWQPSKRHNRFLLWSKLIASSLVIHTMCLMAFFLLYKRNTLPYHLTMRHGMLTVGQSFIVVPYSVPTKTRTNIVTQTTVRTPEQNKQKQEDKASAQSKKDIQKKDLPTQDKQSSS